MGVVRAVDRMVCTEGNDLDLVCSDSLGVRIARLICCLSGGVMSWDAFDECLGPSNIRA